MFDLLIYEPAMNRVGDVLGTGVRPIVMSADGSCRVDGKTVDIGEVAPDIAWANRDLYTDGPVREFMVTCLKSKRLRWLQSSAAGFEHPVFGKLVGNGVTLTNANASAVPIAEFVMARVLEVFHPMQARRDAQSRQAWETHDFRDVKGSTWLIFGLGAIGAEVAVRARAFGAHVVGARRAPRGNEPVDEMIAAKDVRGHVSRADVVVFTAALNEETRHTVDAGFIEAFKPGAVFVNVGRGGLVDEDALLAGLDRGQPSHAVLDVFEEEPLPAGHPLWSHPRVLVSAHCAGASDGTSIRGDEIFLENLMRYVDGAPLENVVTDL